MEQLPWEMSDTEINSAAQANTIEDKAPWEMSIDELKSNTPTFNLDDDAIQIDISDQNIQAPDLEQTANVVMDTTNPTIETPSYISSEQIDTIRYDRQKAILESGDELAGLVGYKDPITGRQVQVEMGGLEDTSLDMAMGLPVGKLSIVGLPKDLAAKLFMPGNGLSDQAKLLLKINQGRLSEEQALKFLEGVPEGDQVITLAESLDLAKNYFKQAVGDSGRDAASLGKWLEREKNILEPFTANQADLFQAKITYGAMKQKVALEAKGTLNTDRLSASLDDLAEVYATDVSGIGIALKQAKFDLEGGIDISKALDLRENLNYMLRKPGIRKSAKGKQILTGVKNSLDSFIKLNVDDNPVLKDLVETEITKYRDTINSYKLGEAIAKHTKSDYAVDWSGVTKQLTKDGISGPTVNLAKPIIEEFSKRFKNSKFLASTITPKGAGEGIGVLGAWSKVIKVALDMASPIFNRGRYKDLEIQAAILKSIRTSKTPLDFVENIYKKEVIKQDAYQELKTELKTKSSKQGDLLESSGADYMKANKFSGKSQIDIKDLKDVPFEDIPKRLYGTGVMDEHLLSEMENTIDRMKNKGFKFEATVLSPGDTPKYVSDINPNIPGSTIIDDFNVNVRLREQGSRSTVNQEELVAHEFLHAATTNAMKYGREYPKSSQGVALKNLEDLFESFKRSTASLPFKSNGSNTLDNPKEFLSWGLTNNKFKEALKKTTYRTVEGKPITMWEKFLDILRLFTAPKINISYYDDLLSNTTDILKSKDFRASQLKSEHMRRATDKGGEALEGIKFNYKLDSTLKDLNPEQKFSAIQLEGFLKKRGVSPKEIKQSGIFDIPENKAIPVNSWLDKISDGKHRIETMGGEGKYNDITLSNKGEETATYKETLSLIDKPNEYAPTMPHFSPELDNQPTKTLLGWNRTHIDDINGKETTVLNEFQSDWAQTERAGRGTFVSKAKNIRTEEEQIEYKELQSYWYDVHRTFEREYLMKGYLDDEVREILKRELPKHNEQKYTRFNELSDKNSPDSIKLMADFPMSEQKHHQLQIVEAIDQAIKNGTNRIAIPIERENELMGSSGVTKFYDSLNKKILPEIRKKLEKQGMRVKISKKGYVGRTIKKLEKLEDYLDRALDDTGLNSYSELVEGHPLYLDKVEEFLKLRDNPVDNTFHILDIVPIKGKKVKWDVYSMLGSIGLADLANKLKGEEQETK